MYPDHEKFLKSKNSVINCERSRNGIGTYAEGSLHAVLKKYYETDATRHELKVGAFYADIIGENGIIEIQTRQLYKLRKKLTAFLEISPVTIVFPIAKVKYIFWNNTETGEVTKKRKSPKTGDIYDIIPELYTIKSFICHENFNLCVPMLEIEEYKLLNGWSKNKKKGSSRYDRIPSGIISEEVFACISDYMRFIPMNIPENFSSDTLAKMIRKPRTIAQMTLNILHDLGLVLRIDRNKEGYIYKVNV